MYGKSQEQVKRLPGVGHEIYRVGDEMTKSGSPESEDSLNYWLKINEKILAKAVSECIWDISSLVFVLFDF